MNLIQSENLLIQFDWSPLINLFVLVFLLLFLNEIISWNLRRRLWLQQVIFIFKGLHKNMHHLYFSHNKIILIVYALMYDILISRLEISLENIEYKSYLLKKENEILEVVIMGKYMVQLIWQDRSSIFCISASIVLPCAACRFQKNILFCPSFLTVWTPPQNLSSYNKRDSKINL